MTEAIEQIQGTAMLLVPELILLATMCVLFLAGPMLVSDAGNAPSGLRNQWGFLSVVSLVIAWFVWYNAGPDVGQGALFHVDRLVWYTRGLSLTAGIILALVLWHQIDDGYAAEAHACLLAILTGTNLVAAADDLVSLFLALELVSIPTYVLLYLPKRDRANRESTIKYFLLSAFSSALVLYGMSWLYGLAGSTNFEVIKTVLATDAKGPGELMPRVAFAFIIAGLSFRIAAVPFHFYAPDVFQGTSGSNVALLSFVPKVVGFIALLRLLPLAPIGAEAVSAWMPEHWMQLLLATMAILTMTIGNLMAWRQTNIYRLLGYSSIAHAGYMLIGLCVGDGETVPGVEAMLFYLAAYGLMTIGFVALLSGLHRTETDGPNVMAEGVPYVTLDDLRGLNRLHPTSALLMAVCLLSLTGLPPTVGFFGKLNLFLAAWGNATTIGRTLAIVLALNAAVGAFYYLRLIALMFLDPPPERSTLPAPPAWTSLLAGAVCTVGCVLLFIAPQWLWEIVP